ncbi:MAG: ABC transporter ATP-binding protein [Pseudonocardia sp.]
MGRESAPSAPPASPEPPASPASPEPPASPAAPEPPAPPDADDPAPPLIGADDLRTPYWAEGFAEVAKAGLRDVAAATPRTIAQLVRWAWAASPRLTLLAAVVQLLAGCATAFGLLATADVLTRLLADGPTPERVLAALPALALVVAAYAAGGLLDAAVGAVRAALAPRVEQRAQDALHAAVAEVDLAAFDDADFVALVQKATTHGIPRTRFATQELMDLLAAVVSMAAAVVTVGVFHPVLVPAVLLAALPQGWAAVRNAKVSFDSFVHMSSRMRRLDVTGRVLVGRDDAAELRALTLQDVMVAEHRRITAELTAEQVAVEHLQNRVVLAGRAAGGIATGLVYVLLGALVVTGSLPLALAGAALVAMRTTSTALRTTVYAVNQLFEQGFYLELYRRCLADCAARRRAPATAAVPHPPETITLRGVRFRYPGQDEAALDGVDLTLHRGEIVALVGENGSGKSTLAKLVTGLYLPSEGQVSWDGVDIATVDQRALHAQVALVMQDPAQWPMTAANNVRVGRLERPDPSGGRFADAVTRSGAAAVASDLPAGWDTLLSRHFQDGRDLSGGQWQRIAVARGLYRDAPVVVADEPTAALDARAEAAVFAALRQMSAAPTGSAASGERITVLVTHRLANVRHADRIVVLERGRIVAQGTHDELMARGGLYEELFSLQARAYAGLAAP